MASLAFGYNAGVPERHVGAVWGARLIFPDDLVYNRQDTAYWGGDKDAHAAEIKQLHEWLNGGVLAQALDAARTCGLRGNETREATLYEDERGVVLANPQSSYGYLYVVAWFKACTCSFEDDGDGESGPHLVMDADEDCPVHGRAADPQAWDEWTMAEGSN